jgi:hypothetical protein
MATPPELIAAASEVTKLSKLSTYREPPCFSSHRPARHQVGQLNWPHRVSGTSELEIYRNG